VLKRKPLFPSPPTVNGLSPKWANLPRRKCDNCGTSYKPVRPLREGERGFCKANCRKEYHRHGGAYRKLKGAMEKMVDKQFRDLRNDLTAMIAAEVAMILARLPAPPKR
jgi:hypothetical protein